MRDHWSYDKKKYFDAAGEQWYFVWRSFLEVDIELSEQPVEIYFRNASRSFFGCIRFERSKDNPYKYEKLVERVVQSSEFREENKAPETEEVWSRNWK